MTALQQLVILVALWWFTARAMMTCLQGSQQQGWPAILQWLLRTATNCLFGFALGQLLARLIP